MTWVSNVVRRRAVWKRSGAWSISLCLFVVYSAGLAYATSGEVGRLTRLLRPTPPEAAVDLIVRNARDEEGRRAAFRILLLTDEYRWRLASSAAVDGTSERPEFTPEMKALLNSAKAIISVGASSEEIVPGLPPDEGRAREERRAARRARQIADWVGHALSAPVPIRQLNAGHHRPTRGRDDTADQRRVVIIVVLEHDTGINMDEALRAALTRERETMPVFDALLSGYSLMGRDTFSWVE